jgi:ATP-dependent Clp protease ATP-binding subunit ClpX
MEHGDVQEPQCAFCGATHGHGRKLIAGPDVYICYECVKELAAIVRDDDPGTTA